MGDLETQKQKSEIFKNYLGVAAVVLGGIWALYNFHVLRTKHTAQLDLSIKESKLVALDLDIEILALNAPCEPKIGLEAIVLIENKGDFPVRLKLANEKTGFGITKIAEGYDKNGHPNVTKFYTSIPYSFHFDGMWAEKKEVVALPGAITEITYFVAVDEPGYYLASFFSALPPEPLGLIDKHVKGGDSNSSPALNIWSATKYFSVPKGNKGSECMERKPERKPGHPQ